MSQAEARECFKRGYLEAGGKPEELSHYWQAVTKSHSNNRANCGMTTRTFQMKTKSQPDREPSRALASAWIKAGCPEKLTVHVGTQIFYLLDGKLVDYPAFALRCPNTRVQQKP